MMNKYTHKYKETGGVHCSALFSEGNILSLFEDLGRHNTMDKIAGDLMLRKMKGNDALLVTTGRISSDMVQKANGMGVSVIVSYSTPTALAKELAEKANMTLVSYFGRDKRAVCTARSRIIS
jgi:FdhD protein